MLGRLLRLANRDSKLFDMDYAVMRKVRDGVELANESEEDAWWWLVGCGFVDYRFQGDAWLTDKGKTALEQKEGK